MGLDMFLSGKKYLHHDAPERTEEGFDVEEVTVKLGYWRKVPDLHGFIVNNYGPRDSEGHPVDDCRDIDLTMENIQEIIKAVQEDRLPETDGFFFGRSYKPGEDGFDQEKAATLEYLGHAVSWLANINKEKAYYSVAYRASW